MTCVSASAPGKLVIAGEYAVLHGHEALSVSIDRRAHVTLQEDHAKGSLHKTRNKLLRSVVNEFVDLGFKIPLAEVSVDSSALHVNTEGGLLKLGLGSSSAICVALTASILRLLDQDSSSCFQIARNAHRRFNNNLGSGIDVATSYYGGAIRYSILQDVPSVTPCSFTFDTRLMLPVYTGVAQSTGHFLGRMSELASEPTYHEAIDGIGHAAARMISNMTELGSFAGLKDAVSEHNYWMDVLGAQASSALLSLQHKEIENLCRRYGGFAKPSGAGGGDMSLCFIPITAQAAFKKELSQTSFRALNLDFCVTGLESI